MASGACLVQELKQLVRGQLDLLVTPLGRPVLAGDQSRSMDTAKIPIDERVAAFGLVRRFVVQPEVPFAVFVPCVSFEERVLVVSSGLNFAPVAVERVLAGLDETAGMRDRAVLDRIRRHEISMRAP